MSDIADAIVALQTSVNALQVSVSALPTTAPVVPTPVVDFTPVLDAIAGVAAMLVPTPPVIAPVVPASGMKFFTDLVTEADGTSFCPARLLLILGALAFIGLAIYTALNGKLFDPQAFGLGYGGVLAGGGGGILMKGKVE